MKHSIRRIAHYAPSLWEKGGIASYVERLGDAQRERGFEVVYYTREVNGSQLPDHTIKIEDEQQLFDRVKEEQFDILHLHKGVESLPDDRITTVRTMHGNQGSCPTGTRFLLRSKQPCDQSYSVSGCLKQHLAERCGSLRPPKMKKNFARIKNELDLGQKLHTFAVSQFLKDRMLESGYPDELLHVLHSPAPDAFMTSGPPPQSGVPRFLFLGRLIPHKGPQWLLKAMVKMDMPVKLDIGGDGPMRGVLEDYCQKHGLQHRVSFHGWLPQDRVKALIAYSRAVIVPSLWHEPAGLVTLEAAAAGRAVIASRVGGIPEYAQNDYALLVNPGDTMELASAILRMAREYGLAVRMGEHALKAARQQYAMPAYIDRQLSLYQLAVDAQRQAMASVER